ncbi:MAG: hypothetical protein MZV70_06280 [Desulfobacterales bacterium]|nr:hypothetical protein [Desulfobacterales bacterium]
MRIRRKDGETVSLNLYKAILQGDLTPGPGAERRGPRSTCRPCPRRPTASTCSARSRNPGPTPSAARRCG